MAVPDVPSPRGPCAVCQRRRSAGGRAGPPPRGPEPAQKSRAAGPQTPAGSAAGPSDLWPLLPEAPRRGGVLEHLAREVLRIGDLHIDNGARAVRTVSDGLELRHDEARVRRQMQFLDARDHLVAQLRIEVHAVAFKELLRRRIVTFSFDALHFGQ